MKSCTRCTNWRQGRVIYLGSAVHDLTLMEVTMRFNARTYPETGYLSRMSTLPYDLDRLDALAVFHAVAGVEDHFVAFVEAFQDLDFGAAAAASFNGDEFWAATVDEWSNAAQSLARRKRAGRRDFQDTVTFPDDNMGFDAKIVAERAALLDGCGDIDDARN